MIHDTVHESIQVVREGTSPSSKFGNVLSFQVLKSVGYGLYVSYIRDRAKIKGVQ